MPELITQLRQATHSLHTRIEKTTPLAKVLQTPLHQETYIQALNYLYSPIFQLETAISKFMPEFHYQARHPLLAEDLKSLGAYLPEVEKLPHLELSCEVQKYGYFYVLIGSQLGGYMIAAHIKKHAQGLSSLFFDSSNKKSWQYFIKKIKQTSFNQDQEAHIMHAAITAFELFLLPKDI